jgi:phage terminase large subunit-like protein
VKESLRRKRLSYLKTEKDSLKPHRLYFPRKIKGEPEGAYRVRKFLYFCSHYLVHVHGVFGGRKVQLMRWQLRIVEKVLGTFNPDGTRQYRKMILHVGRKNGKSFLATLFLLYFLCEESFIDEGMEICSVALSKVQSQGTIFKTARMLVERSKEVSQLIRVLRSPASLTNRINGGVYEPLSSDGRLQLGRNLSLCVIDEGHGLTSSEIWDSLLFSMSLRKSPLLISVSTAGESQNSFYYNQVYLRAKEILKDPAVDSTTAPFVFEVPLTRDWTSPDNFILANPALGQLNEPGFRPAEELNRALKDAMETESEGSFRQFYLNQFGAVGSQRSLVSLEAWDVCANPDLDFDLLRNCPIWCGVDLSSTTDLSSVGFLIKGPEKWVIFSYCWLAGTSLAECEKRDHLFYSKFISGGDLIFDQEPTIKIESILSFFKKFKPMFPGLLKIGYDPYLGSLLLPLLPFFELVAIPQVAKFMSPAIKFLRTRILESKLQHTGSGLLRAMIENAKLISDINGNLRIDKIKSFSRMDGLTSIIIAAATMISEEVEK